MEPTEISGDRVTELLVDASRGDQAALNQAFLLVYDALRVSAGRRMARERAGHTLCTTDLVHEAYLKLVRLDRMQWQNRAHFLAMAAQSMRNILIDHALKRNAEKRGGGGERVTFDEEVSLPALAADDLPGGDLLALDRALRRLEAIDARQCRVVECRVFAGMSVEETAEALEVSPASIKRDWTVARAFLNRELAA